MADAARRRGRPDAAERVARELLLLASIAERERPRDSQQGREHNLRWN
jgi:hypothetical protein